MNNKEKLEMYETLYKQFLLTGNKAMQLYYKELIATLELEIAVKEIVVICDEITKKE